MGDPKVGAPAPSANRVTGAGALQASEDHSTARAHCACCRRYIEGAVPGMLGVRARCWGLAGERIKRLNSTAIEKRKQAEVAEWREAFDREEARLQAIERQLQAAGYKTVRVPAENAEGWR